MIGPTDMIGSTITAIPTKFGSFCLYRALLSLIKTALAWEQIPQRFGAQIGHRLVGFAKTTEAKWSGVSCTKAWLWQLAFSFR
jgi:hypothetical protein